MKALSPIDNGFLTGETRQTPMHVGGLVLLRPPAGTGIDNLADIYRDCISETEFRRPFDQKLVHPASRAGYPHWEKDPAFDVEYHVRHSALPRPGRYRELFALVSRLHGSLLDRTRPLWEFHLIEGLESGQFAMYTKMHHAMIDGMAGMRMLQASLSEDPDERGLPVIWSAGMNKRRPPRPEPSKMTLAIAAEAVQSQLGSIPGAVRALTHAVSSLRRPADERMALPFQSPRSSFNTRITGARRFVAQSYSMERIDQARKKLDATVNDIVLAMCSSALRRYLQDYGDGVPDQPLTAMAPVSIRPSDGDDYGNAVSAILVNLGTHIADPIRRIETIRASVNDGKALVSELTYREVLQYTMLMGGPMFAPTLLGVADRLPAFNVVISNVPGPKKPMYWNGARLEGLYPVSIVFHGSALNFTVSSYAGSLDFGITACRRSVPRVQRFIDFLEDGLKELERV